jgi:hypothetical protein
MLTQKTWSVSSLEDYLESLREGEASDGGEFTIAAERAKALLAGRALGDVWAAWLCLAQGFLAQGTGLLEVAVTRRAVIWRTDLNLPLVELLRHERFLLGWLNLGWFGSPHWTAADGTLTVEWRGNAWHRYRLASTMESQLRRALMYSPVPVTVGGSSVVKTHLPVGCPLCLYPLSEGLPGGFDFEDDGADTRGFFERRRFSLDALGEAWREPPGSKLGAFASKSKASWSQVTWVHFGVVIANERGTLDRPNVAVVASVEALGLETDLSGFSVVTNEAYFRFIREVLRRDVMWML